MKEYTQDNVFTAMAQSNDISSYLHTAGWFYGRDEHTFNHNIDSAIDSLRKTADTLGFELVEKEK